LTKSKAEIRRSNMFEKLTEKFCPMIRHRCRPDCICLYPGRVYQSSAEFDTWAIVEPRCTNPTLNKG